MKILAKDRLANVTPNKAVHNALVEFEKQYGGTFNAQEKTLLARLLGKKSYLANNYSGLNLFEYLSKVSPRKHIEFRSKFANFDTLYELLSKDSLVAGKDESRWSLKFNPKGQDLWYFLAMAFK